MEAGVGWAAQPCKVVYVTKLSDAKMPKRSQCKHIAVSAWPGLFLHCGYDLSIDISSSLYILFADLSSWQTLQER